MSDPNLQLARQIVELTVRESYYDLILLLHPTVAFVQDGCRVDSHEAERENCLDYLRKQCEFYGQTPKVVEIFSKDYNFRFTDAVKAVEEILND